MKNYPKLSKNFSRHEAACKCGCGFDTADVLTTAIIQQVRDYVDEKVIVTSWCRCEKHNKDAGGKPDSQHLYGRAVDFYVVGYSRAQHLELFRWIEETLMKGEGGLRLYKRKNFIHLDTRTTGVWR